MNPIKILSALTRLITLSLSLILVLIVLLAAGYHPESGGERGKLIDPENPPEKEVNLFADDPGFLLFDEWDCDNCHEVNRKKLGPALAGVTQRREKEWIYAFVQNSSILIGKNDPTAVALFEEFNKLPMPIHDLSTEQIDLIMAYIEKASE